MDGELPASPEQLGLNKPDEAKAATDVGAGNRWSAKDYEAEVENTSNPFLREYEDSELRYLTTEVKDPEEKTFIDIGAGGGRVTKELAKIAHGVVAVEIDPDMLEGLRQKAQEYPKIDVVAGDANHLDELLVGKDIERPVVMCLQNSLGTWKGDRTTAIDQMRGFAESKGGELIISLFRQEALKEYGIDMYRALPSVVGEPDLERTDFEAGVFRGTKDNYSSKWATAEERAEIAERIGGTKVNEILTPGYWITHISY